MLAQVAGRKYKRQGSDTTHTHTHTDIKVSIPPHPTNTQSPLATPITETHSQEQTSHRPPTPPTHYSLSLMSRHAHTPIPSHAHNLHSLTCPGTHSDTDEPMLPQDAQFPASLGPWVGVPLMVNRGEWGRGRRIAECENLYTATCPMLTQADIPLSLHGLKAYALCPPSGEDHKREVPSRATPSPHQKLREHTPLADVSVRTGGFRKRRALSIV